MISLVSYEVMTLSTNAKTVLLDLEILPHRTGMFKLCVGDDATTSEHLANLEVLPSEGCTFRQLSQPRSFKAYGSIAAVW